MLRILSAAILVITLLLAPRALADGKAFTGVDRSSMFVGKSNQQHAWISCDGTRQRMIIAIGLRGRDGDTAGLWLVPVRGRATEVSIGRLRDVPRPGGRDPRNMLGDRISDIAVGIAATQLWPVPISAILLPSLGSARGAASAVQAIDQDGLRTELIDADSAEALRNHLAQSGAAIPADGLDSFGPYFDGGHCFVATWISDAKLLAGAGRQPAMLVDFPSTELWYPMRATSGYGEQNVNVWITVDGLVSLKRPADGSSTHYRTQRDAKEAMPMEAWLGRDVTIFDYSVIRTGGLANEFTADLFFEPVSPKGWHSAVAAYRWVGPEPWKAWLVGVPAAMLAMAMAGAIAGGVTRSGIGFGALVGLSGMLTFATTWYLTRAARGANFDLLRKRRGDFLGLYTFFVVAIAGAMFVFGAMISGMR